MIIICCTKKYNQEKHRNFSEAGLKLSTAILLGHIDLRK
jgi:hypothetical protein